jgi:hypothetical protein
VADNVRPLEPKMTHEQSTVGGVLDKADRARDMAAARAADAMIPKHAVMIREGWLIQQRHEPTGEVARVNQHHRLSFSSDFILKLNVPKRCPIHLVQFHHDAPPFIISLSDHIPIVRKIMFQLIRLNGPEARSQKVLARFLLTPHRAQPLAALR